MPEAVLPIVFSIALLIFWWTRRELYYTLSARISMTAMLGVTGIAHFTFTEGMEMMLPDFVPFKTALVHFTGILELLMGIGILIPKYQRIVGRSIILFFILILPANIHSCIKGVHIENATYGGDGLDYLWYRIPLQVFFILWVYLSAVKEWAVKKGNALQN